MSAGTAGVAANPLSRDRRQPRRGRSRAAGRTALFLILVAAAICGSWLAGAGTASARSSWTNAHFDGRFAPEVVSCAPPSFCATDTFEPELVTFNGSAWSATKFELVLAAFIQSCGSPSFCAAIDNNLLAGGNEASLYEGSSWSALTDLKPAGGEYEQISCTAERFCLAVGEEGYVETYNGSAWGTPVQIDPGVTEYSISCVSSAFCMRVGGESSVIYDGHSWSAPRSTGLGSLASVSCTSTVFCAAVNATGSVVFWNGSSWRTPIRITGEGETVFTSHSSLSCVSTEFCVAVSLLGEAYFYEAGTWSGGEPDEAGRFGSVSCTSPTFCVAVGEGGATLYAGHVSSPEPPAPEPHSGSEGPGGPTPSPCCSPPPQPNKTPAHKAAVPQLTAATVFSLPSPKQCVSRRRFTIHVRTFPGITWIGATITINHKRVKTVGRAHISALISLLGLPKGTFVLSITATTSTGRKVTGTRTYHTCVPKSKSHYPAPKL